MNANRGGPDQNSQAIGVSRPLKRSFTIAGHKTSISLEAAFWDAFRELCSRDGRSMAATLAEIDRGRSDRAGLSGAVRVWILQRYRNANCSLGADQSGELNGLKRGR